MSSDQGNGGGDWDDAPSEATRIDLGDDLLEKTAMLPAGGASTRAPAPRTSVADPSPSDSSGSQTESLTRRNPVMAEPGRTRPDAHEERPSGDAVSDALENAKIMIREGLLEEAKKTLHQLLLDDPRNLAARSQLALIHDLELKQMFSDASPDRFALRKKHIPDADTARVLEALDRDLGLGLSQRFSLAEDEKTHELLARCVESEMEHASVRDHLDLGIGFLEMGLPRLAVSRFTRAKKDAERTDDELRLASISLLAYALIADEQAFEARMLIEPVIADSELGAGDKVEFFYLMGRACEADGDITQAAGWYRQVVRHDPYYRDATDRLRRYANATRS